MSSVFETLNKINVNEKVEKKNGLSYLSWAYAWGEVKKIYPDANYVIYERDTQYGPINYFTDGMTCWVKTGVIINGLEHIEELPVMDFRNKSILLEKITSFDVNKAIQRSLTKALARHGLGLYIYAGEDLPEGANDDLVVENQKLIMEMDTLGIDFREQYNSYILEKTKLKTQDFTKLNSSQLSLLNNFYKQFIQAYHKKKDKSVA